MMKSFNLHRFSDSFSSAYRAISCCIMFFGMWFWMSCLLELSIVSGVKSVTITWNEKELKKEFQIIELTDMHLNYRHRKQRISFYCSRQ